MYALADDVVGYVFFIALICLSFTRDHNFKRK